MELTYKVSSPPCLRGLASFLALFRPIGLLISFSLRLCLPVCPCLWLFLFSSFMIFSICLKWLKPPFLGGEHSGSEQPKIEYWATCSSVCSFSCTAYSFASHCLLCSRAPLGSFLRLLTQSQACGEVKDWMSQDYLVLSHCGEVENQLLLENPPND